MNLPASLKWVEVDLPDILDYKESVLKDEKPVCSLERVRADLADAETRRVLFSRLNAEATRALVVREGLLIYLPRNEVATFAQDLRSFPAFKRWLFDISSPPLLRMLQKNTHSCRAVCWTRQFRPFCGLQSSSDFRRKPTVLSTMSR